MMRPNALKGNDRIELMRLNKSYFHYFLLPLSTATATFGGRCARELLSMASMPSKIISALEILFLAFLTKALHTHGVVFLRRKSE